MIDFPPAKQESLRKYRTEFDATVGKLKRAMMDAFVRELRVNTNAFGELGGRFLIKDDYYELVTAGWSYKIVRPDDHGVGGGALKIEQHSTNPYGSPQDLLPSSVRNGCQALFAGIESWVDDKVEKWKDLPDYEDFTNIANQYQEVSKILSLNSGHLSGHIKTLEDCLGHPDLTGETIISFQDTFVNLMRPVLVNYGAVVAVLTSHFQAQHGLWVGGRAGFIDIVEEYTRVFNDMAQDPGTFDATIIIRAFQYAAAVAGVGSVAGALNWAAQTLTLMHLSAQQPSKRVNKSPGSLSEGMTALASALWELNDNIYDAEKEIREIAYDNLDIIGQEGGIDADGNFRVPVRKNLELILEPMEKFDMTHPEAIGMDGDLIKAIIDIPMKSVAEELHTLLRTTTTYDDEITDYARRDERVGVGRYGPSHVLHELNEVVCDLLRTLKWKVEQGGQQLWLAYQAHVSADGQAAIELAALNAKLAAGSGFDPWDYQTSSASPLPQICPMWVKNMTPGYADEFSNRPTDPVQVEPEDYLWREHKR